MAAFFALLDVGDTFLAMDLACGGHLTHGLKTNFSGKFFKAVSYGVDKKTECLDYDNIREQALKNKPKLILAGASAYPRIIDFVKFKKIADEVGAYLMVDMAHIAGLVVAGLHPNPVEVSDIVTTTTHKTLRGPRSGLILCKEKYAKKIDTEVFPGIQGGPLEHVISAKAVAFKEAMAPAFKEYQKQIVKNAARLSSRLSEKGYRIVSGGTDNHLFLMDLSPKNMTGKAAECALDEASITVNKNLIPYDKKSPFVTSGLRIGTPAVTTRGMKEKEMDLIADYMDEVLRNPEDKNNIESVRLKVKGLVDKFPLFSKDEAVYEQNSR
jgi:glycine hydroxymethyltransferase